MRKTSADVRGFFRVSAGQLGALLAWPMYAWRRQFPLLKQGSPMPWTWLNTEKLPRSTVSSRDANHLERAMLPVCSVLKLSPGLFGPCWRRGCHLTQRGHWVTSSAVPRGWPYKPQRGWTRPAACLLSLKQPAFAKQTRNGIFPCLGDPRPRQPHTSEGHNLARGGSSLQST